MSISKRLFKIAYKKLKSSVYYDKTQAILRNELVNYEAGIEDIEKYLDEFAESFADVEKRNTLVEEILSTITYYAFPKKLAAGKSTMITNYVKNQMDIEENQYFINMDIRGHILGVLWLMLVGYRVDQKIYKHSYGNRIRSNLYNELSEEPTYSPYLFEPYFQQYESWRDKAMNEAVHYLHSGQDVVILTLDFKRFFYSLDISESLMEELYKDAEIEDDGEQKAVNDFVFRVVSCYASLFNEFDGRKILPIGFLPSNILANYALRNFDQAVLDGWNPIYFGRYVDDVIIVDKIVSNSDLYKKSINGELEAKDIIAFFLEQCSGWRGLQGIKCRNEKRYALLQQIHKEGEEAQELLFSLNCLYNPMEGDKSKIVVQNDKVKIFYFRSGESDALITCFRETIAKNKSEFRHMPEDEAVFRKDDFSGIYDLQNDETINKFRGITGISVDKFELSKWLGKHMRICGLVADERETTLEAEIAKIFNPKVIIENYGVWEKVIEILAVNGSYETLIEFVNKVVEAIDTLLYEKEDVLYDVKNTMYLYLYSSFCRPLALVWGRPVEDAVRKVCQCIGDKGGMSWISVSTVAMQRKNYCGTRMLDKSVMPIFIDMLRMEEVFQAEEGVSLSNFNQMIGFCRTEWKDEYIYYPYLLTMYDFSMIACIEEIGKKNKSFSDPEEIYKRQVYSYIESNYRVDQGTVTKILQMSKFSGKADSGKPSYLISVDNGNKDKLKLAIANVRLKHDNFVKVVKESPNRGYERYELVSKIINGAIDEHADMVIMPEAFMPFEWLPTVARTCARNSLALVTGVEHIKIDSNIYNLTAVILPYEDAMSKNAYISFHLKTYYAPAEKREINGYRLHEISGKHYEIYKWYGCYFPVYCCYELTSIIDRSMFQSYADFLVAIEWNRDVNYYSNILESLSRDIHCYCVQVNSSDYGDSRITRPSKTEEKDIMRTKGGINSTILVDEIDIGRMREFQLKEYELQATDKSFKPTPPGFQPDIVLKKIKGEAL